jgi:hypothetical protein
LGASHFCTCSRSEREPAGFIACSSRKFRVGVGCVAANACTSRQRKQKLTDLSLTDLAAHAVFLLIQRTVFLAGDVSAILTCHQTFFVTDLTVVAMQAGSFRMADFAAPHFLVDSAVLIGETAIHLRPARMRCIPVRRGGRGACKGDEECTDCGQFERVHDYLLSLMDGLLPFISSTPHPVVLMTLHL